MTWKQRDQSFRGNGFPSQSSTISVSSLQIQKEILITLTDTSSLYCNFMMKVTILGSLVLLLCAPYALGQRRGGMSRITTSGTVL